MVQVGVGICTNPKPPRFLKTGEEVVWDRGWRLRNIGAIFVGDKCSPRHVLVEDIYLEVFPQ